MAKYLAQWISHQEGADLAADKAVAAETQGKNAAPII
jgi:hypothetical protein